MRLSILIGLVLTTLVACDYGQFKSREGGQGAIESPDFLIVRSRPLEVILFMESLNGEMGRTESYDFDYYQYPDSIGALQNFINIQWGMSDQGRVASMLYPLDANFNDINKQILAGAVEYNNEADFLNWLEGILHPVDYNAWLASYNTMKPIYEELYWIPFADQSNFYRQKMRETAEEWDVKTKLECVAQFYDAEVDSALRSTVAIFPLPVPGEVLGESVIGTEFLGVHPESDDYHGDFSVIFHEKLHTLFSTRSALMNLKINYHLQLDNSIESQIRLMNFDEALATFIGNVWAYKDVTGEVPPGMWYNDEVIDTTAKTLAPMIAEKLDRCEPMDDGFLMEAARLLGVDSDVTD